MYATPHSTYKLTISAGGYAAKTVVNTDWYPGNHSGERQRFLNIVKPIIGFIESEPDYKTLPEPSGAYI